MTVIGCMLFRADKTVKSLVFVKEIIFIMHDLGFEFLGVFNRNFRGGSRISEEGVQMYKRG